MTPVMRSRRARRRAKAIATDDFSVMPADPNKHRPDEKTGHPVKLDLGFIFAWFPRAACLPDVRHDPRQRLIPGDVQDDSGRRHDRGGPRKGSRWWRTN